MAEILPIRRKTVFNQSINQKTNQSINPSIENAILKQWKLFGGFLNIIINLWTMQFQPKSSLKCSLVKVLMMLDGQQNTRQNFLKFLDMIC